MCRGAPVCRHTFRCLCGWGDLVSVRCSASGVVHQAFWRQHVSETWGSAVQLSWLARELQAPLCHRFPSTDNASAFKKMLAWGSNLGPHACVASTLSYLPSPGSILSCSCMPSKGQPVVDLLYWPVVTLFTLDIIMCFCFGNKNKYIRKQINK